MIVVLILLILTSGDGDAILLPRGSFLQYGFSTWLDSQSSSTQFGACSQSNNFDYDSFSSNSPTLYSTQLTALQDMYGTLGGVNWSMKTNWNIGDPCFNSWFGVECDCSGHVIGIVLPDNRLIGTIPSTISNLVHLRTLDMHSTAPRAPSLPNVDANHLSGALPSLASIGTLAVLDLSFNEITDVSDIVLNTDLEVLALRGNRISSFPDGLEALTKLKVLDLSDNMIVDTFPSGSFCQMPDIYVVNVGNNTLSGTFDYACWRTLDPLILDISARHPWSSTDIGAIGDSVLIDLVAGWKNVNQGYLSFYLQNQITGHFSSVCQDIRFCQSLNFRSHEDLALTAGGADVPADVYQTIALARTR